MYWRFYCGDLLHRGNAEYETREENDTSKKTEGKINSQIEISFLILYQFMNTYEETTKSH